MQQIKPATAAPKNWNLPIILAALLLTLPIYFRGVKGFDFITHIVFSRNFAAQFWQGDFFPRWLVNENLGFGAPSLMYYPSLQYYITALFAPLNLLDNYFSLPQGYLAACATSVVIMACAALAMNKYLKTHTTPANAALLAIFYLTAPYFYSVDLFMRFALPEMCGFIFMPLCLYYSEKNKTAKLAFGYAGLLLTHLLTAGIFTPVLVLKVILERNYKMLFALPLGVLLAAYYLLPALSNHDLVSFQLTAGIYNYGRNFLDNGSQTYYLLAAGLTLFVSIFALIPKPRQSYFWLLILCGSVFMALSYSKFIWELLTPLALLSFPWRFLSIASLATTMIMAQYNSRFIIGSLIGVNLCFSLLAIFVHFGSGEVYLQNNMITIDDYRTKWTDQSLFVTGDSRDPSHLQKQSFRGVSVRRLARKLIVASANSGWTTIPHFYFPNWHGEYQIRPQAHTGFIEIYFPHSGTTELYFTRNSEEKLGFIITALTLLGILFARRRKAVIDLAGKQNNRP